MKKEAVNNTSEIIFRLKLHRNGATHKIIRQLISVFENHFNLTIHDLKERKEGFGQNKKEHCCFDGNCEGCLDEF